ncbi:polyketide cyclase/dehydrase [Leptolyngbya sp. BL0902]|uniref:SRPBCC family protein n=1 Tax=Leptolyngbya sp. BL0902 TaxID=1115757 RepID=UPI0018E8D26E|nr:SRPBCC family protein [Leptolyngbya sp. BL0902]QQE66310.1 polyketide cyclase/dehydrase [Leptolyngbya sp. BL0902]
MSTATVFQQSITIRADPARVDRCFTDLDWMHRWLNPALRCEPIDPWDIQPGSRCRFQLQIPLWQPSLRCTVVDRAPGLIVWAFEGFFHGQDRWQYDPTPQGTILLNRFEFEIPNPLVAWGFHQVAAPWTQRDMQAQLQRLKTLAEGQS